MSVSDYVLKKLGSYTHVAWSRFVGLTDGPLTMIKLRWRDSCGTWVDDTGMEYYADDGRVYPSHATGNTVVDVSSIVLRNSKQGMVMEAREKVLVDELALGYLRYEALRKLNAREFADLLKRNRCCENFDCMVDKLIVKGD